MSKGAINCGAGGGSATYFRFRVASVFIILVGSVFGALFPVLAGRSSWLHVHKAVFDFAKYFGSGVIIATAFIHLLDPAIAELSSPCLAPAWQNYPYALALALLSIFGIFILELIAFRWGTAKLAALNMIQRHDHHKHNVDSYAAHGSEGDEHCGTDDANRYKTSEKASGRPKVDDIESVQETGGMDDSAATQIIGVCILEFGIVLHSILIGMTLAVNENFIVLFVVMIFHQLFEGLGLGSRLAMMQLPTRYNYVPIVGALLYGITTPLGIAVGLGVHTTYNPGSTTASIVSGVLDSLSAGILIYTGLVELLAHEFLFNEEMINGSNCKLAYALFCMIFGCGIMSLLAFWV